MTDEQLDKLAGPDAVQYIRLVKESLDNVLGVLKLKWNHFTTRFQKYLLVLIGITTLLCICIILPFNFQVHNDSVISFCIKEKNCRSEWVEVP